MVIVQVQIISMYPLSAHFRAQTKSEWRSRHWIHVDGIGSWHLLITRAVVRLVCAMDATNQIISSGENNTHCLSEKAQLLIPIGSIAGNLLCRKFSMKPLMLPLESCRNSWFLLQSIRLGRYDSRAFSLCWDSSIWFSVYMLSDRVWLLLSMSWRILGGEKSLKGRN
jgi:hypothetical protein